MCGANSVLEDAPVVIASRGLSHRARLEFCVVVDCAEAQMLRNSYPPIP